MQVLIQDVNLTGRHLVPLNYRKIKVKAMSWNLERPISKKYITEVVHSMVKTCMSDDGIGLAAPQLGIYKQLFVIRDMQSETNAPRDSFTAYFNPTWTAVAEDGKETSEEGCLSVPGWNYNVDRWKTIQAKWFEFVDDGVFLEHEATFTGFMARVFQHEFDHLVAKSIVDRGKMVPKK